VLKKENRLITKKEITGCLKTAFKISDKGLTIFLRVNKQRKLKLLVIVSKKIFKKANKRNRLKRKINAYFTNNLHIVENLHFSCIIKVNEKKVLYQKQQNLDQNLQTLLESGRLKVKKFFLKKHTKAKV